MSVALLSSAQKREIIRKVVTGDTQLLTDLGNALNNNNDENRRRR